MHHTVIKHSRHLRTLEKCRKHLPAARVFYISLEFSNARRVLPQCNTRLRLLYLLNIFIKIHSNENKTTKVKVKSEKPLEVGKRTIDPIRGEPPQDQSKNHISKSNLSSPEISSYYIQMRINYNYFVLLTVNYSN